jgi:putative transposase
MMEAEFNHLNHATWECKYHVVFTPKYRKKLLFGKIKRHLGQVFHDLARRKECRIEEGHLMPDHVHMLISIPPKYSVGDCSKMRDPVSAIIFCSANPGQIDRKTRSKWSRVLWYAAHYKPGSERLDAFIKRKGGINECAERYTERLGRPDRNVMYSLKKRCRKLHRLLRKKMKAGPLVSNFY